MAKLKHYGIQEAALRCFSAYLIGRRQRVRVESTTSAFLPIWAGVPQGSVLGPVLFLVYTINLPAACENASTKCSQFADDTALVCSSDSAAHCELQLQSSVSPAAGWLVRWHLLMNTVKTVVFTFYNGNRPPRYLPHIERNNAHLRNVLQHRHLGIIYRHDLKWSAHLDFVLKKAVKSFNILFRLRSTLHSKSHSLSLIYKT